MNNKKFYILIIVLLVLSIIVFGRDLLELLGIGTRFLATTTESRVSNKSTLTSIKYSSTDNIVEHKNEIFIKLKDYNNTLIAKKGEVDEEIFEIKNIHKIKDYYMDYKKYFIVKYKLFNMIEDIPKLRESTQNMTDLELSSYFSNNRDYIENIYGITDSNVFREFVKSLSFFNNSEVKSASVRISSIINDKETFTLMFKLVLFNNKDEMQEYHINSDYYKTTENQIAPYIGISAMQALD